MTISPIHTYIYIYIYICVYLCVFVCICVYLYFSHAEITESAWQREMRGEIKKERNNIASQGKGN